MANQHVNKVAVNGKTVLDLSGDTVYPGMLAKGITAHDKSGAKITGTLQVPASEERTVELSMPSGNQVILPTSGKVMRKVTVQKPTTLLPGNVKKGVVIGGVTGTLEASSSGGAKETWVLNEKVALPKSVIEWGESVTYSISFVTRIVSTSTEAVTLKHYNNISFRVDIDGTEPMLYQLLYDSYLIAGTNNSDGVLDLHRPQNFILTFDAPPTGDLLTWLQANGVKQPDDTAVQDTKALTITSNGTVSVTPDAPYDALKKVDVTVNVASGGGGGETTSLTVNTDADNVGASLFCLWQTSDGWMGTATFDSVTNFTIPNVIVGGYVIFTRDPASAELYFSVVHATGVEDVYVDAVNAEFDVPNAALVMQVTAPSPSFYLLLKT